MYIVSIIFIIMGIGIKYFKWDFLIAGYNTMNKEQKEEINVEGLCNSTGNFMLLIAALMLVSSISHKYGYRLFSTISIFSILPLTVVQVVLSQKYDKNKGKKGDIKFTIGIIVFTCIIALPLLLYGGREPKVQITDDRIIINGIYGTAIKKEKVKDITLEDTIPKVINKVDGFDFGYTLKGNFKLEELGVGNIYIHENRSPYIIIKTENRYYIINYKDSKKTISLYNKLK